MDETVLIEIRDRVAVVTLNRPGKLNALSYGMVDRLQGLLGEIASDDGVHAVVLTGSGRAFSAGADIYEFSGSVRAGADKALAEFVRRGQGLTRRIETFAKPVVAAVNGIAVGGGCEIVEACHLAVASERAVFGKPEITLGMPPTFGGTQRLPRLAGRKRSLEHLLTGDSFGPERAREIGLVNRVVAHDALLPETFALLARILRHSPLAAARILAAVTRGLDVTVEAGLAIEAAEFARMVPTADLRAGLDGWMRRAADAP